jgi:arsenate reductase-like glutaredoxin family protein
MQSVYLDNTLGFHKGNENNLQVITQQLDNGKRSLSTISAMLAGMGIPKEKVLFAIQNYTKAGKEAAAMAGCDKANPHNIKNKYNMQFNLSTLGEILGALKTNLYSVRESNVDKLNYSANTAYSVVESVLREIFDLQKTLGQISEKKEDVDEVTILKESLHPGVFKSKAEFYFLNKSFQSLQPYNDVVAVKEYLETCSNLLKENYYTNFLSNLVYEMLDLSEHQFYADAIEDIQFLLKNDEPYIKENLTIMLNKHSWIPRIKQILDINSKETRNLTSNDNAVVERVFSPIHLNEEDGSYTFALDNKFYQVNPDKTLQAIEDTSKLNEKFVRITALMNNYKIDENKVTLYKHNSSLELIFEEDGVSIDGVKTTINDFEGIRNNLMASSFFRLDEVHELESVLMLVENIDNIKHLDIVDRIVANNGNIVNIIKLNESNIYINRVNQESLTNDLFKAESSKKAQEIVNEFVDYDISNSVHEILEKEDKERVDLNNLIKEHEGRVQFLNEQLDRMKKVNLDLNDLTVIKAIEMLEEELKKEEVEVQRLYEEKAKLS